MVLLGLLRSSKLVLTYDALVRDHQPVEQAAEKTSTRAALRTCESHKRGVTFNGSAELDIFSLGESTQTGLLVIGNCEMTQDSIICVVTVSNESK